LASRIKVYWSHEARKTHRRIREYIALDNPQAARKWAFQTREAVKKLAELPRIGRVVPEFGQEDLRELIHGRHYRIVYRLLPDEVEIVTFAHTAQLLTDLI
jgi:toxin ParE1/3/4